ncbi:MAG: glycosyl transferase family A [Muribaculaceae bacterium]|nr:glycosyl transferase family A [Muribaculaceae bacterium]
MVSFKVKEEFWKNFDVSVVIPFYKKMAEFRRVFPLNRKYFERNGIEVVIVLDTPLESEELLSYIQQYPFVNWRIVMNDKPHEWRNPAKPLNVGIRHATKKYVMVCSPESEMVTDVIYILRKSFDDYSNYPHYAIGRVCFADEEEITVKTFNNYRSIPFGSIMFEREHAEQIHGYDETLSKWGGDDNNIRSRFDMIGVKELYFNEAMMAHRDINNNEGKKRRGEPFEKTPNNALRHFFFPTNAIANGENWGQDFDEIIYDWSNNKYAEQQLQNYANQKFIKYEMTTGYNKKSYPVILLVQSYNESKRITHFLKLVSVHFDGIVILDDESTDNTYNLIESDKIIIKAQKKRTQFNDLENRNILLDLASFVNHKVAFFLDVDELLDEQFCNIHEYLDVDIANAYMIPYIHLWDSEKYYNSQYPSSVNGICFRYKMIRNIGHTQIFSNRGKLHFHQAPTVASSGIASKLLIKHYGLLTTEDRMKKYAFYQQEDDEGSQSSYEHFGENALPNLGKVNEITFAKLNEISKNLISHRI